jgi:hypothetical protein
MEEKFAEKLHHSRSCRLCRLSSIGQTFLLDQSKLSVCLLVRKSPKSIMNINVRGQIEYEQNISDALYVAACLKRQSYPYTGRGGLFQTFGSQMAARLSALRAGRFVPPGRFLELIFVTS